MAIGIYFSTRRNYRRREEHGSAKWGNADALNKKYRDKDPSEKDVYKRQAQKEAEREQSPHCAVHLSQGKSANQDRCVAP